MPLKPHQLLIAALILTGTALAKPQPRPVSTVLATENGGSYTYVQLNLHGKTTWYAIPAAEFKVGEKVVAPDGMAMKNFYSKALDRTFDVVYFADGLSRPGTTAKPNPLPPGHPSINTKPASVDFTGIERPEGGKTVAEIHQESATLNGQQIIVRGKAVKVTNGIMGKNWIHLQDGSGTSGTDDLTITTKNTVQVGTTITATGTLATDRDFGYGYTYAVLLEDAHVTTE